MGLILYVDVDNLGHSWTNYCYKHINIIDEVNLFVSENNNVLNNSNVQDLIKILGQKRVKVFKTSTGPNGADFCMSVQLGMDLHRFRTKKDMHYRILSNDKGFKVISKFIKTYVNGNIGKKAKFDFKIVAIRTSKK